MPHTPGTFCWYEIATPDVAAAKTFYTSLFGWTTEDHPMPGDSPGSYTMLRLGGKDIGGMFGLEGEMAKTMPPNWGAYVAQDDVDATAAKAKNAGATLLYEPMDVPSVGRMCAFQSPTGEVLSIYKGGEHEGGQIAEPAPGAFCWSELLTRDPDKSGAFYTNVLGWGTDTKDMPIGPYTIFKAGDKQAGGMMPMPPMVPGEVPTHWMHYVMVTDCKAATDKARSLGAQVIIENKEVPTVGTFSTFSDPTGPVLSIMQFA